MWSEFWNWRSQINTAIAGNELSGNGVGTTISAQQYAEDMRELRFIIDTLYVDFDRRPLVVAPDGFLEGQWDTAFLNASGPGVVDVFTRHIYNLGPGLLACSDWVIKFPQLIGYMISSFLILVNTSRRYRLIMLNVQKGFCRQPKDVT